MGERPVVGVRLGSLFLPERPANELGIGPYGVTQVGGLAVMGEGLFLNTSASRPAPKKAAGVSVRAVPMDFGAGSAGLGFVGTF